MSVSFDVSRISQVNALADAAFRIGKELGDFPRNSEEIFRHRLDVFFNTGELGSIGHLLLSSWTLHHFPEIKIIRAERRIELKKTTIEVSLELVDTIEVLPEYAPAHLTATVYIKVHNKIDRGDVLIVADLVFKYTDRGFIPWTASFGPDNLDPTHDRVRETLDQVRRIILAISDPRRNQPTLITLMNRQITGLRLSRNWREAFLLFSAVGGNSRQRRRQPKKSRKEKKS